MELLASDVPTDLGIEIRGALDSHIEHDGLYFLDFLRVFVQFSPLQFALDLLGNRDQLPAAFFQGLQV